MINCHIKELSICDSDLFCVHFTMIIIALKSNPNSCYLSDVKNGIELLNLRMYF